MQCMSSPLKTHRKFGAECRDEAPISLAPDSEHRRRLNHVIDAIQLVLDQPAALTPHGHPEDPTSILDSVTIGGGAIHAPPSPVPPTIDKRTALIARVACLMAWSSTLDEPDVPFSIFMAGHQEGGGAVRADWVGP
jgi:hypothetical protein